MSSAKYPPKSRALFVSHASELGGAELFLRDLVIASGGSWGACFLAPGPAAGSLAASGADVRILKAGSALLSVKRKSGIFHLVRSVRAILSTARELATAAKDYDVICANSQKSLFVAGTATLFSRKPLVWCLHDIMSNGAFSRANRFAAVCFANLFAVKVVVNSTETGRSFVAAGGRSAKVALVYNGFDPADWTRPSMALSQNIRKSFELGSSPVVGLFGRLSAWKGQHVLLAGLEQLPGVGAIFVGGALFGQSAYEASLRDLSHNLGISERVRFLGNRDDVAELMAAVDVVVHASVDPEPFGRVIVEAMLVGTPVVATRGGGVTEIIVDKVTGRLVPPGDARAMAVAISELLADKVHANEMARSAKAVAEQKFNIQETLEGMDRLFLDAISGSSMVSR